eukprot:CAMPEP_0196169662 /NCGR_PEP_ID=MMETSP0911-20130528/4196_1 /TAXON_ID=49265 /ORGANISM="Thalassiosira rotula, Strain GSO102" /LENGTH=39 /DNA_ID= /DNA_START= /DNA_END= /DNA_ORIENTATION=
MVGGFDVRGNLGISLEGDDGGGVGREERLFEGLEDTDGG